MTGSILASSSPGEVRVALIDGAGALLDYALHRPGCPDGVGDLHLGRVTARLPALGGAFVQIGRDSGFLPETDEAAAGMGVSAGVGALIAVRVTRSAQGGKGPRLTGRLTKAERARFAPEDRRERLVARGPDALQRLAAFSPDAAICCDDAALSADLHVRLGRPVRLVARAFDDRLEAEIDSLGQPEIALPGGLRASIHPTPALVAIDIDGAASSAARQPKPLVQFAANRAAIPALAHHLRLRNLSGAILIDLAGLTARKRRALAADVEAALGRDPLRPRLLGLTALGLLEILRPRVHPPLHELLQAPLGSGLAALRAALAAQRPRQRQAIRGGIAVITALRSDAEALAAFALRAGMPISLDMDAALPPAAWIIENA